MTKRYTRWAIQHCSKNRLDGERKWLAHDNCLPMLFVTKTAAQRHIKAFMAATYSRPDLRREPHGWRMPRPVRVAIETVTA